MLIIILTILISFTSVCFFCLGFISKELVLYGIKKSKQADEQVALARKIIDSHNNTY